MTALEEAFLIAYVKLAEVNREAEKAIAEAVEYLRGRE